MILEAAVILLAGIAGAFFGAFGVMPTKHNEILDGPEVATLQAVDSTKIKPGAVGGEVQ